MAEQVRIEIEMPCEYCRLSQEGQEAIFHIDHVIPLSAGGETIVENPALACVSCSLRKAARQTARDPESSKDVPLYNPRRDSWSTRLVIQSGAMGKNGESQDQRS